MTAAAPLPAGLAAAAPGRLASMLPAAFASVITGLRELGSPYRFAHGLIDYGQYLMRAGNAEAAAVTVGEARDIAGRLRCQPLLDRAAGLPSQKRESRPR